MIVSSHLLAMVEDAERGLWLGTEGGGLSHYDPEPNRCVRYLHDPDDPESMEDRIATFEGLNTALPAFLVKLPVTASNAVAMLANVSNCFITFPRCSARSVQLP